MAKLIFHRATAVWLLLVGATGLSWEFGHGFGFGDDFRYGTVAVVIIAFVKLRLVFLEFMELRHAPAGLRLAFEAWTVVVCAAVVFLYWSGSSGAAAT